MFYLLSCLLSQLLYITYTKRRRRPWNQHAFVEASEYHLAEFETGYFAFACMHKSVETYNFW